MTPPAQPVAVPSAKRAPNSPFRTCRKGAVSKQSNTAASRLPSSVPSSLHPTVPVELPLIVVESVAQKTKATSPLNPRQTTLPTNSPSAKRWELAHSRIKGRFVDYNLETFADLPYEPDSRRWQEFPEDMGAINIGLLELGTWSSLLLTHFQGELYKQVIMEKRVDNVTNHILLRSLLGAGAWLQLRVSGSNLFF